MAEKKEDAQTIYTDLRKDLAGKAKEGEEKAKEEAADDKAPEKYVSYKGALPLFKKFTGEKTPTALMLLFADQAVAGFKQDPPILLTDGKAKVKLSVGAKLLGKENPSFAVSSAKILSLAPEEDGSWTLVVQPKKDAVDSVLSISSGAGGADISLLVAPIIDPNLTKSGKLSEADFALFLKETGTPKAPKFDLNGDGKRDYLDDYIFTANYLVKMKIKPESLKPKETPKPKETDQKSKTKESGKKPGKGEEKGMPEPPAVKEIKPAETKPAQPEKKETPKEQK
ncbi:hypothetical protein [Geobacter argillaceus]|uniref:Uncharacterized protein n=1 Tax=Geobacter argillaceus TaxID=345631 RepID=A0A562VN17_9BACT|nr:hypothetical protein [Geobacter argillaceus]TWJ19161.1 hypothetical protein JN12_02108 [Geobacter argillaceus]